MASARTPTVHAVGGDQAPVSSFGYDQLDRRVMVSAPGANDTPQPAPGDSSKLCAPPSTPSACGEPSPKPDVTRTSYALAPASVAGVPGSGTSFGVAERVSVTDPRGNTSMKDYDAVGNLVKATSPPVEHAGSGAPVSEVSTYEYDQNGDRTGVVRPLGNASLPAQDRGYATTSKFGPDGRLSSSVDGKGNQTTYSYDPDGNLSQVRRPGASDGSSDQQVTSYTYNGRDLPASTQTGQSGDGSLRTTISEYDPEGNLRRTVSPAGVDDSTQGSPRPYQDYTVAYSDPRGLGGAGDPASGAAGQSENVNATIRVYDADNVLTNVFSPWGCRLGANDSKTQCQVGQIDDKRRFRQDFTIGPLGRTTGVRESFEANGSIYPTAAGSPVTYKGGQSVGPEGRADRPVRRAPHRLPLDRLTALRAR